jgi:hypothetical protein
MEYEKPIVSDEIESDREVFIAKLREPVEYILHDVEDSEDSESITL